MVPRGFYKLHQPFVIPFFTSVIEIGRYREILENTTGLLTSCLNGPLSLFGKEVFPKDVDTMFGPSTDEKAVGIFADELNGISYFIAPEPRISRNNHGIVFSQLYLTQWNCFGIGIGEIFF